MFFTLWADFGGFRSPSPKTSLDRYASSTAQDCAVLWGGGLVTVGSRTTAPGGGFAAARRCFTAPSLRRRLARVLSGEGVTSVRLNLSTEGY